MIAVRSCIILYSVESGLQLHSVRVRYHDAPEAENTQRDDFAKKKQSFLDKLRNFERFDVVLGRCVYDKKTDTHRQKGVDVNIALDIVTYCNLIPTLIVVSADSDLIPAFDIARKGGAEIVLYLDGQSDRSSQPGSIDKLIKAVDVSYKIDVQMVTMNNREYRKYLEEKKDLS